MLNLLLTLSSLAPAIPSTTAGPITDKIRSWLLLAAVSGGGDPPPVLDIELRIVECLRLASTLMSHQVCKNVFKL